MKTRLLIFTIALLLPMQLVYAQPVPEPEPVCKEGTILTNGVCVSADGLMCGSGTTYQDGICVVDKIENTTEISTDPSKRWDSFASNYDMESPLKQFKSGITIDEIQCRDSLVLVTKHDGSPACVKPETIPRLMERNWIKDDAKQQCETFSGIWNKDFATCFDFSDEYDCKDMGGKPMSRSYTGEQPDYSKKSDSFACEFRK